MITQHILPHALPYALIALVVAALWFFGSVWAEPSLPDEMQHVHGVALLDAPRDYALRAYWKGFWTGVAGLFALVVIIAAFVFSVTQL